LSLSRSQPALAAAGEELPIERTLDGRDPIKTLAGGASSPHEALFWVWNQGRQQHWSAIRQGQYKLVRPDEAEPWELYDLAVDVGEEHNLAAARPELVLELAHKFAALYAAAHEDR
jgi:arylsulfatase A